MYCKATSKRTKERCRHHATPGREVCRHHGGRSLLGPASPSLRTGQFSKFLPSRMAADFERAVHDPALVTLRKEIATVDARIIDILKRVDTGEAGAIWVQAQDAMATFGELIDSKRKLVEAETRRVSAAAETLTADRAMLLLGVVVKILQKHITDRAVLGAIANEIQGTVLMRHVGEGFQKDEDA
jgi:hypothetical protein